MGSSEERVLGHARVLRDRGIALPPGTQPPAEILDSWVRCAQSGLDFAAAPEPWVVGQAELQRRREAHVARRLALAELETLMQEIAGSNFLLAFADRDGVILDLYADNRFATSSSCDDIVAGSCWSEAMCGTNGLGTALATGRAAAVEGPQHYFLKFGDISCTAAPVRDAAGGIVGVLDASSYYASRQRHTQALVQMAATNIENRLLAHQMRNDFVLAIHPRGEFLRTLRAGLVAFGEDGVLHAANDRARALLAGLDAHPGARFEELFDARFDRFASSIDSGVELRLRDVLGSTLAVACIGRPTARPVATAAPRVRSGEHVALRLPRSFVADEPCVREAIDVVNGALRLDAPVLIEGETGTGKELLARYAHDASGRSGEFVAVNCGAMPTELFEAELFGYVGGAFTGARREGASGLIASAHRGTLLLDEIGELPLPLQAALLRFLDERAVRPVGGTRPHAVDVRVIAATNVDLEHDVAAKRFRADLFHRLNTVRVALPPLRQRRDFARIATAVLFSIDPAAALSDAAIERLARHDWPGNVRELRAILTRALLRVADGRIDAVHVDALLPASAGAHKASALQQGATEAVLREFKRTSSVSETARNLGVSRTTVYRHLRGAGAAPRRC